MRQAVLTHLTKRPARAGSDAGQIGALRASQPDARVVSWRLGRFGNLARPSCALGWSRLPDAVFAAAQPDYGVEPGTPSTSTFARSDRSTLRVFRWLDEIKGRVGAG